MLSETLTQPARFSVEIGVEDSMISYVMNSACLQIQHHVDMPHFATILSSTWAHFNQG
jgi:hypothetical protein